MKRLVSVKRNDDDADVSDRESLEVNLSSKPLTVHRLIRSVNKLFFSTLQGPFGKEGMSPGTWHCLNLLCEEDGISAKEISARAHTTAPSTVEHLEKLRRRGLITSVRNPKDRRSLRVYVTPKGRTLHRTLIKTVIEVNNAATAGMTPGDIELYRRFLITTMQNLTRRQREQERV